MKIIKFMLLNVLISWSISSFSDSSQLINTTGSHDVYHGAEFNPTGDPIGGGAGYSQTVDATGPNTVVVDDRVELICGLATAEPGSIIYVNDNAEIDLTCDPALDEKCGDEIETICEGTITISEGAIFGETIKIPGGVTLASGRGKNGSQGARLYVTQEWQFGPNTPLFGTGGPSVRITGLRIEGPDNEQALTTAIRVIDQNCEIDNSEIYNWSHGGIYALKGDGLREGSGLKVHHNYIHHNYHPNNGYGVVLDEVYALIEANYFDFERHGIAGTGKPGTSYEARYNVFGKNFYSLYPIDMHGGVDRGEGNNIAGSWMVIHHNSIYKTDSNAGGVHISGRPQVGAWVFSNWFESTPTVTYRHYPDPHIPGSPCNPCFGETDDLGTNRIFSFNNRVGLHWGWTLPFYGERHHMGDFNGDGLLDLLTFEANGDFMVRKRIANSGFEEPEPWGENGNDIDMRRYRIADVNADGRSDVISFHTNAGFYVWLARSVGGFENASLWGSNGADINPVRYKVGDFNGDGRADIISFHTNGGFYVWLAAASGGFQSPVLWGSNGEDYGTTNRYRLADVDGDNRTDVVSFEDVRFYVWWSAGYQFSNPAQWGSNGAVLPPYRYQLGNAGAGSLSDVISYESNGGKYIWNSNGSNAFVLWGEWFSSW